MSDRTTTTIATVVLVACLAGAAAVAGAVQKQREELELVVKMEGIRGMPPHVAIVTAALGTFRGLAVDVLWARADHLQTEGDFYEAQTLAQWITMLQPRFQKVWGFQAWNLSWNIAAATQVPAERWGWVSRGIDLLRSRGIPLNPKASSLYFDLAWIFQGKIARIGDKDHWYYKARLAAEMQEVVGNIVAGRTTPEALARFRRIVDAPRTLDELTAATPAVQRALDAVRTAGLEPDEGLLRMLGRVMMRFTSLDAKVLGDVALPPGTNRELVEVLRQDPELASLVLEQLVPHLQRRVLEDHYRMEPAKMLEVMKTYGPLDWRHPQSHGIYWSEQGVAVSRSLAQREDTNELMLVRGRLMMLLDLMRTGRVEYDPVTNRVDLLADPRFARSFEQAIQEAFALIASDEGVTAGEFGTAEESDLFATYERFLDLATTLSYLYGDQPEAERYFTLLKDLAERQGFGDEPAFSDTVENFVAIRFAGMANVNPTDLRQLLDALLRRGLLEGLAKGDTRIFGRFLRIARTAYDRRYAAAQRGEAFVLDETKLLPFPKLVDNSFDACMRQASVPLLTRARIWAWAPEHIRQSAAASLVESLRAEATAAGLDADISFPAPARPEPAAKQPTDAADTPSASEADDGGA